MRTLYLCYFGLREPLVQTQVLPYLRELSAGGVGVSLLTFEPDKRNAWTSEQVEEWRARLQGQGIRWFSLPYHKRPSLPATVFDICVGAWKAARLARRYDIELLHARGHIAAAIGAITKRFTGSRLLFDIRGFMPEEYADAGIWPRGGYLYRLTKAAERRLFNASDGFVVLTDKARAILFPGGRDTDKRGRPVEVIPCCVDFERFKTSDHMSREDARKELGVGGRRVLVYVGALGGWYLTKEMVDFFLTAHEQDEKTFSMVLTQSPPEMIVEQLKRSGIDSKDFLVKKVWPSEVPRYLKAADVAVSFIKPCYSKLSSSPTKIAEYLASGLPIISNSGIGDLDELIEADRVGVILREFNRDAYISALTEAEALREDGMIPARCRESARRRFDLKKVGGARYLRLYNHFARRDESDLVASEASI